MQSSPSESLFGRVLTVSQVTQEIKELLEDSYPLVWIEGEISNLRLVQSGHAYFTLKDTKSSCARSCSVPRCGSCRLRRRRACRLSPADV